MPAVRIKDHWREQRLFDQRALACAAVIGAVTIALIARLFVLQVSRHDYYAELSQWETWRDARPVFDVDLTVSSGGPEWVWPDADNR